MRARTCCVRTVRYMPSFPPSLCALQAVAAVLVLGLLLASLAIGVALAKAQLNADASITFTAGLLAERMAGVRSAAATLASDLGLDAAALAAGKRNSWPLLPHCLLFGADFQQCLLCAPALDLPWMP